MYTNRYSMKLLMRIVLSKEYSYEKDYLIIVATRRISMKKIKIENQVQYRKYFGALILTKWWPIIQKSNVTYWRRFRHGCKVPHTWGNTFDYRPSPHLPLKMPHCLTLPLFFPSTPLHWKAALWQTASALGKYSVTALADAVCCLENNRNHVTL